MALDDNAEVTIRSAIAELNAEHTPIWFLPGGIETIDRPMPDKEPVGCRMCWPRDGSWPCTTALVVDDLISLLPDREKHSVDWVD